MIIIILTSQKYLFAKNISFILILIYAKSFQLWMLHHLVSVFGCNLNKF